MDDDNEVLCIVKYVHLTEKKPVIYNYEIIKTDKLILRIFKPCSNYIYADLTNKYDDVINNGLIITNPIHKIEEIYIPACEIKSILRSFRNE